MKKPHFYFLFLIVFITSSFGLVKKFYPVEDKNQGINFQIKYWMGTCKGTMGGIKGVIVFDPNDLSKSIMNVTLDVNSIKTGNETRDKHLKEKEEWFNAVKYPTISFKSSSIEKTPQGFKAAGDLTIKSITKKVYIPFTFHADGNTDQYIGTLQINRLDFKVGEPSVMVKDIVDISINSSVKK